MFGQDWDKAEATIVARDAKFTGDGSVATYTYVADVRLASGETFRATIHEPTIATDFWAPSVRDVVSVLVRPKDRKVKFDKDDERLSVKAFHAAKKKAFEDAQQQLPGMAPAAWPTSGGMPAGMPVMPTGLPPEVAAKLAQLGLGGGTPMVVTGDSPQGQAILAAMGQSGAPVAAAAPAAQTPDARLLQLKSLHDRGLLTADEYAEQRRRILDEI
jgi:hypothetical protein